AVRNDDTSENKKFLGITPRKIRLPKTSYVGYNAKKYQLQKRLYNHALNLLGQQEYRVIN
ncbi:43652_t:CDS:2, partial [Gigaspora margarita]